jgi:hypothetical protein
VVLGAIRSAQPVGQLAESEYLDLVREVLDCCDASGFLSGSNLECRAVERGNSPRSACGCASRMRRTILHPRFWILSFVMAMLHPSLTFQITLSPFIG